MRKFVKTCVFTCVVLGVTTSMALAGEMMCFRADDRGCTMAKDADGKEMAVMGVGIKAGDKMDCMNKDGKMICKKMLSK